MDWSIVILIGTAFPLWCDNMTKNRNRELNKNWVISSLAIIMTLLEHKKVEQCSGTKRISDVRAANKNDGHPSSLFQLNSTYLNDGWVYRSQDVTIYIDT